MPRQVFGLKLENLDSDPGRDTIWFVHTPLVTRLLNLSLLSDAQIKFKKGRGGRAFQN